MKGALTFCAICRKQVRVTKCTFFPTHWREGRILAGSWVCDNDDCKETD